jgi:hypothetical protein
VSAGDIPHIDIGSPFCLFISHCWGQFSNIYGATSQLGSFTSLPAHPSHASISALFTDVLPVSDKNTLVLTPWSADQISFPIYHSPYTGSHPATTSAYRGCTCEDATMKLLDLPKELFQYIIHVLVLEEGVARAWKYRDVCRK